MELREVTPVGGGGHLRLTCVKNGTTVTCMRFGVSREDFPYAVGERLDLAVTLELREFRGEDQLTVSVRDVKLSGLDLDQCIGSYRVYEKGKRGERLTREEGRELLPSREELAALYRLLAAHSGETLGLQTLAGALAPKGLGYGKILVGLEMLEERKLIALRLWGECLKAQILPAKGKTDMFQSAVYRRLAEQTEEAGKEA